MIHEGERLDKAIKGLKRQLEAPIDDKKRRDIEAAITELQGKKAAWERPH